MIFLIKTLSLSSAPNLILSFSHSIQISFSPFLHLGFLYTTASFDFVRTFDWDRNCLNLLSYPVVEEQSWASLFKQGLRFFFRFNFCLYANGQEKKQSKIHHHKPLFQLSYLLFSIQSLSPLNSKDSSITKHVLEESTKAYFKGIQIDFVKERRLITADNGGGDLFVYLICN
ncbi:hypothetical protein HID58_070703 [Brassica napus]|uniref:Uncharacterized protein n=1 Tax=Brassica napus TaxID=3708 RepID=A0ABQ7YZI0_BRANA|nr:hypothetical protein HID58_070703 [Brassica napus]